MATTEMDAVRKFDRNTKQQCLSAADTLPKYVCQDILEIRKFQHTLFLIATRIIEFIIVYILIRIIQLLQHEFDELPNTSRESASPLRTTSMMSTQYRLDPTGGDTIPSPTTLLAEGETSKTPTLTLTPQDYFLAEGRLATTSTTTTTVSLAQT